MQLLLFGSGAESALHIAAQAPLDARVHDGPQPGDRLIDRQRLVAIEPPGPALPDGPFRRAANAILSYRVFPEWLMRPALSRAPLQAGDTFGNRVGPLPGLEAFFAGRVKEAFDGPDRAGFTLQVVEGHPAVGEETIEVRKDVTTGEVFVRITSWSRPATWWVWLGLPLFRLTQSLAVAGALGRLALIARGGPSTHAG
jgi:uncharacterized protein (UPF0548 family)